MLDLEGMMLKRAIVVVSACIMATTAQAGPFGVEMGQPLSSLTIVRKSAENFYVVTPPLKNSEFELYQVYATPQHGVCKISGLGVSHKNDRSGYEIKDIYADLLTTLTKKYGSSKRFDFLHAGSIWDEPYEFAMALSKEEYSLSNYWLREEGSTLPPDLEAVTLSAEALDSSTTYVTVSYEFENFKRCKSGRAKTDEDAL